MSKKTKSNAKPKRGNNSHEATSVAVADKPRKEHAEPRHDRVSVSFESSIPREEAVSYFETLVAGLKKGTLHLKQDANEISLQPPAQLDVKVKASSKREKEKIAFEISWRAPNEGGLTISSE